MAIEARRFDARMTRDELFREIEALHRRVTLPMPAGPEEWRVGRRIPVREERPPRSGVPVLREIPFQG